MPPSESAQERRERLLAAKAALIQQIQEYGDRIVAINEAPKRPLLSWDSDSDTSVVITPPPALREIHNQNLQSLNNRLLATKELRGIQKLDIEVEVLNQRPDLPNLAAEEVDAGAGVWREVSAEGRTDIVPFEMHFYVYENKRGAMHYRSLTTTVVKIQHKAELQTILNECQKPGLAIECISRYSCGYTERKNTLLELNEMFGSSLECGKLESGGFRLSCGGIVLIDWILECGVMKECRHRFRFQVADECDIDDELYTIMKKAQQKLKEKDLSPEYRSRVLKKLIEICLGKFDLLPEVKSESDGDRIEHNINSNGGIKGDEKTVGKRANIDGKEYRIENTHVSKRNVKELEDNERIINVDQNSAKKFKENNGKKKVKNFGVKTSVEDKKERVTMQQEFQKENEVSELKNDYCRMNALVNKDQKINDYENVRNISNKENEIETESTNKNSGTVSKSKDKPNVKHQVEHLIPYVPKSTEQVHKVKKIQPSVNSICVNKKGTQNVDIKNQSKSRPKVFSEQGHKNNQSKEIKEITEKSGVQQIKEQTTKICANTTETNFKNKGFVHKKGNQEKPPSISNELLQERKSQSKFRLPKNNEKEQIVEKKHNTKENKRTTNVYEHDKIQTNDNKNVTKKANEHVQKDKHNKQNVKENRLPQSLESKNKNIESKINALSSKSQKITDQVTHKTRENRHTSTAESGIQKKLNTITDVQKPKTSNSVRSNVESNIKPSLITNTKVLKTTEAKLKSPVAKSKSSTVKSKSTNMNQKSHTFKPKSPIIKGKSSIFNPKVLGARPKISNNGLKKTQDRPKSLGPMDKLQSKISLGSIENNKKHFVDARPKSISNFGNKGIQKNAFRSKIPTIRTSPRVAKSVAEKKTFWTADRKR